MSRLKFIQESIDTQLDDFGDKLASLVKMISEEGPEKISERHPVIAQIEKIIFNRFGLLVSIITDEAPAAILPFYSNRNHIFLNEYFRGNVTLRDQNKILKNFKKAEGSVDLQKAKVTGIFSEYEHPLYLNFTTLLTNLKLTVAEVVGVILHELGHGFEACYFSDRTDRTNQVLASAARKVLGEEKGELEYVYKELLEINPSIKKESVDKMLNGNRVVAGLEWFKAVVGVVRSQTTVDLYNETAFEASADNFASRFGYGKHLLLALDKISAASPEKSNAILVMTHMANVTITLGLAAFVLASLATGLFLPFIASSFYLFLVLIMSREDSNDYTYDKLKQRYLRVRKDAVDQLKGSKKLKQEKVKEILESIYSMDEVIKNTAQPSYFSEKIANFVFSTASRAQDSVQEQQILETLSSNELLLKPQISTCAKTVKKYKE